MKFLFGIIFICFLFNRKIERQEIQRFGFIKIKQVEKVKVKQQLHMKMKKQLKLLSTGIMVRISSDEFICLLFE
jgi:hypothetical protein